MNCRALIIVLAGISFCVGAMALEGSGDSAVAALETVRPTLESVSIPTETTVEAAFSEPMLAPGATTLGNYAVSGLGAGTLATTPDGVAGSGPYALTWAAGEMRDGVPLTLTATGVQDAVGNPINPAANSASALGVGMAPVFSGLMVMPPEAAAGDTVTISFTASETLKTDPEVTVNGHPATAPYGKADGYSYEYEVSEEDLLGMAQIQVSGADLAGNQGTLENTTALEIVEGAAELPLTWWPWAALLLLALGLVFIREKRGLFPLRTSKSLNGSLHRDTLSARQKTNSARDGNRPAFFGPDADARKNFGTGSGMVEALVYWLKRLRAQEVVPFFALLYVVHALACSFAFADAPTVSNVTMTQSPNATSTQVDIHYDLVAPNGPCAITVSLSKDGGADGFSHAVTSVTGDLSGVTTGTDHTITWDIATDYPDEDIPNAALRVTAEDGAVLVQYYRDDDEDTYGQDGDSVWAVSPAAPYTATQGADCDDTDPNINPAMSEVCCNSKDDDCDGTTDNATACTFTVTYSAGAGGSISGTTPQDLYNCETGTEVTAVPNTGYHFVDWSDGVLTASRTDGNLTAHLTVTAAFEENEQTIMLPGDVPLELVWIPSGSFQMGRYTGEQDSNANEDPQHSVTVPGFWMAKYELTKAQWTAVMGSTPWDGLINVLNVPNSPAVYVSWNDAQSFITALNGLTGLTFRLPSEAEWEYACRAGTTTRFYWGDDASYTAINDYAWWYRNAYFLGNRYAHSVGLKTENAFGLYDMSGNVYEWCEDDWHDSYTGAPVDGSAWVDSPRGSIRVHRGGGWYSSNTLGYYCRSAYRRSQDLTYARADVGFRLSR